MKTLVSFVLGTAMLFGAATLGLQSGSANAKDRHDKKYSTKMRTRHHRHHRRHLHSQKRK